jgi:hypothetical protein
VRREVVIVALKPLSAKKKPGAKPGYSWRVSVLIADQ